MKRILEPELMNEPDQVADYIQGDFSKSHKRFIKVLGQITNFYDFTGKCLDIGCGPGDISFRLSKVYKNLEVQGIDGAERMIFEARKLKAANKELYEKVNFSTVNLPSANFPIDRYNLIVSNTTLHHFHNPFVFWDTVRKACQKDAYIYVGDFYRKSQEEIEEMVFKNSAVAPPILNRDFRNSLYASFSIQELEEQIRKISWANLSLEIISDRHLIIHGMYIHSAN